MFKKLLLMCLTIGLLAQSNLNAQTESQEKVMENVEVSSTKATFLGKTKPLRELVAKSVTSQEKLEAMKRAKKKPKNFVGRKPNTVVNPELEHQGIDPLRQLGFSNLQRLSSIETLVNVDGLDGPSTPNDPTGDVGENYFVQSVNATQVGVFNKDGSLEEQFSMNTLWSELGASSAGDPIVLYDEIKRQWILTEFTTPANLLIAISETNDPLGSYYAYSFSTPNFPDYPKYGIWSNALVVTSNEDNSGPGILHQYFLERDSLMIGASLVRMQRVEVLGSNSDAGFLVTTPVDWNGVIEPSDTRPITMRINDSSWGQVAQDQIEMYHFDINFDHPDSTNVTNNSIVTTPFDGNACAAPGNGFQCIPQMNGGGLDGLPELIMHVPHYRNFGTHESIVLNFLTDVTDGDNLAGIRWVELRKVDSTDWQLYQEGTFAPDDGLHRFMGGIAMDKNGNIGLAYNVSGENDFVGIRFTGRFAADPLGIMTIPEINVIDGAGPINSGGRFGDYSQMSIDPLDQTTFWFTTEYAAANSTRTRIMTFQLAKDTFDLSATKFITPTNPAIPNASQQVTVLFSNAGLMPISNFEVGFSFENVPIEQMMIPGPLMPDSSLEITFTSTVDISAFGLHDFSAYIVSTEDQNERNDTINKSFNIKATRDARLIDIEENVVGCADPLRYRINYINDGIATITRIDLELQIDGAFYDDVALPFITSPGNINFYNFNLSGLPIGEHTAQVSILKVNNGDDEVPEGNVFTSTINVGDFDGRVRLELMTDRYPEESAWSIVDVLTNEVVAVSAEYSDELSLTNEDICLARDRCYRMSFTDTYNDGICCGFSGNGFFNLFDSEDNLLFESNGQFGGLEEFEFCLGLAACNVSAEVDITHPTAADSTDGVIMITALNGSGSYNYSIDSGVTYQSIGIFNNLPVGTYHIFIQDSNFVDCLYADSLSLTAETTSTKFEVVKAASIKVLPNPNNGFFKVEVSDFETNAYTMDVEVRSLDGRLLQVRQIGKYDDVFVGQFSLVDYPDGTYILRFVSDHLHAITKVIKHK